MMRTTLWTNVLLWPVFTLSVVGQSLSFAQEGQSADPESFSPPPVFQPDEIQHGFSEFDSLPEIYADDPPPTSPHSSSGHEGKILNDPDQKPGGLFFRIDFAEGFEEEQVIRRGHVVVPVNPTNVFPPDTRVVYLVFSVFKHSAPYQVFGRLYREKVNRQVPTELLDEDSMLLAAEDESGYLQFFPQNGRWTPGTYQVRIFVGWETSEVNRMGTMRFRISPEPSALQSSPN